MTGQSTLNQAAQVIAGLAPATAPTPRSVPISPPGPTCVLPPAAT